MNDLDFSFRGLRKNRGTTALTVLALILGDITCSAAEGVSTNSAFSIQQQGETAWLVRPNGERFFSLGVCVMSQGASRKDFNPANPAYAARHNYADSDPRG